MSNNIIVHQAYYGEKNNSHSCLGITIDDPDLKSFLTAFTDRPNAVPPGVTLKPYVSGRKYRGYYILTKTFPDKTSKRSGMVFTHALIINLEEAGLIDNLGVLFDLFVEVIPELKELKKQIINKERLQRSNFTAKNEYPKYLQLTAKHLTSGKEPVLICGDLEVFSNVVEHVWNSVSSKIRKKIKFKICFAPSDNESLTFAYIQRDSSSKWNTYNLIDTDQDTPVKINSYAESFVLNPTRDSQFAEFIDDLNVDYANFSTISTSSIAYEYYSNLSELDGDSIRLLARFIGKISPNPKDGKSIKSKVIGSLKKEIEQGKDTNLKSLRNLDIDSFDEGRIKLRKAISNYLELVFKNELEFKTKEISDLGNLVIESDKKDSNWWKSSISDSINSILIDKEVPAENIWSVLGYSQRAAKNWFKFIPNDKDYEKLLFDSFPNNLNKSSSKELIRIAKSRKWYLVHAKALLNTNTKNEAIIKQLAFEKNLALSDSKGVSYLCRSLKDEVMISLAISEKEPKLIQYAGKRLANNETLFSLLDYSNTVCLKIWAISLDTTQDIQFGDKDNLKVVEKILSQLLNGKSIPNSILKYISQSDYSNLANYKKREKVWEVIPSKFRDGFLNTTALGIVDKIVSDEVFNESIEREVVSKIKSHDFMVSFTTDRNREVGEILRLYKFIPELEEKYLKNYLKKYSGKISDLQSDLLGSLINELGFSSTARVVFDKAKKQESFRIALNKCQKIITIGLWDKLKYGYLFNKKFDSNVFYKAVTDIAIKLYPKGPEDNDIWSRAGGELSKFKNDNTREEEWRKAIHLIRFGGGGEDISIESLLFKMKKDFPHQERIEDLITHYRSLNDE